MPIQLTRKNNEYEAGTFHGDQTYLYTYPQVTIEPAGTVISSELTLFMPCRCRKTDHRFTTLLLDFHPFDDIHNLSAKSYRRYKRIVVVGMNRNGI
jgi:hypothetical protein